MLGKCILFAKTAKYNKVNARHFKIPRALSVVPAGQVATAGQKDASLFAALATAAQPCMGDFTSQALANMAWAFATAGQKNASLFAALSTSA